MKLPDNLTPIEYKLKIVTNLGDINGKFSFNGSVSIEVS